MAKNWLKKLGLEMRVEMRVCKLIAEYDDYVV
jgi:hypothetical protein